MKKPYAIKGKKKKCKYLFIQIEERNGEQEYTFRIVREVPIDADNDEIAEHEAKTWYGDEAEENDGRYEFFGGSIVTSVDSVREISKTDYDVLTKYI